MKILAIYGTRPEYLKIKPVVDKSKNSIKTCFIRQHTDIIDFGKSDYTVDINNICENRLNSIFSQIFSKAEKYISEFDAVLIQGDTATVLHLLWLLITLEKK